MNQLKKISLVLVAIALSGCKTLELGHVDLDCVHHPETSLSDRMTDDQLDSMTDEVFDIVELTIEHHKERLKSQCKLIQKHNKNYH